MSEIFNDRGGRPPKRGRVFQNSSHVRLVKQELNSVISIENQSFISSFRKYKIDDQNFDENFVTKFSVGSMNIICHHCDARHFQGEMSNGHFNNCCQNGLISLPSIRTNTDLKSLFLYSPNFIKHIRNYNSAVAFASFSANRIDIPGDGPYCFKVQGSIYR